MSRWYFIREQAGQLRREALDFINEPASAAISAERILSAVEQLKKVPREPLKTGDSFLDKAVAKLEYNVLWYDAGVDPGVSRYYQAHEYAHLHLGHGACKCSSKDITIGASDDRSVSASGRVEGYSAHEIRERQANIFAQELLLPRHLMRRLFITERTAAEGIAAKVGVNIELVCHQLAFALLTPDLEKGAGRSRGVRKAGLILDQSQRAAAEIPKGPLLVEAGPGTGKTTALVGRILYLLESGVKPESILALTFSNKAAEEMRERLEGVSAAASQMWVGTFHAFGLEILRKYGSRIGLPAKPAVIDTTEAVLILERSLAQLGLSYYQDIREPTRFLPDILGAISRAKDEAVDPNRYLSLSQDMLAKSASKEESERAEKALEVARVYAFYQEYLEENGLLDFGDLIFRSLELLRYHLSVLKELKETFPYILIDEYQDVNRASGLLLKELAGDGEGLWAVGDVRQSIHRWRGAAPENVRLFSSDFAGAKILCLEKNYRSREEIIDVFTSLAPKMSATEGLPFTPWVVARGDDTGSVLFEIADSERAEVLGIAGEIKRQFQAGVPYSEQAVICRTHSILSRIALALEKEDIPALYLGDIFERAEVKDMLSLLSLASETDGKGLMRVSKLPEYNISENDVDALYTYAKKQRVSFPEALKLASSSPSISTDGKAKFALLDEHLRGLHKGTSAWKFLTRYLFVRSAYLQDYLHNQTAKGAQQRMALYRLLQFAHENINLSREKGVDPKLALLRHIRRLEIYGEERALREIPAFAEGIEAIRLITVHASKGLEFTSVYLPTLGGRYFPGPNFHQPCPPPEGMLKGGLTNYHLEEEECLFFVALSRAKDYLCLSHATRYGNLTARASKLLGLIKERLPRKLNGAITWKDSGINPVKTSKTRLLSKRTFLEHELSVYMKCPRRYYYEFERGRNAEADDSAFTRFRRCVLQTLNWLNKERSKGVQLDPADAFSQLAAYWQHDGPVGHANAPLYLTEAETIIKRAVSQTLLPNTQLLAPIWELDTNYGHIKLQPDSVEVKSRSASHCEVTVRRLLIGPGSDYEKQKPIYALYHSAAEKYFPQAERSTEVFYLTDGTTAEVMLDDDQVDRRVKRYEEAILGIQGKNFEPRPNRRDCPRCPHFIICSPD